MLRNLPRIPLKNIYIGHREKNHEQKHFVTNFYECISNWIKKIISAKNSPADMSTGQIKNCSIGFTKKPNNGTGSWYQTTTKTAYIYSMPTLYKVTLIGLGIDFETISHFS